MKYSKNCNCQKLSSQKLDMEIPVAGQKVFVKDVPIRVCDDCGEIYVDGKFIINLERQVKRKSKKVA